MTDSDEAIRELLRARGVPEEEIEQASAAGRLGVLAMSSAALVEERRYTLREVAERADMAEATAMRFWRALGFPAIAPDERAFTASDAEALTVVRGLIDLGLTDEDVAVQMTRVIGSSMARIAEAQVQAAATRQLQPAVAELAATVADSYLATQATLLEFVWRRHLEAAGRRLVLNESRGEQSSVITVGFADLVGFTALSQQLDSDRLASVVDRFEEVAYDTVTAYGGRVAKMIGDEAMFVVDDVRSGVEIGLRLAEEYADDDLLSDVRVGLACGSVLVHEGDYYGPTVNLASRIVGIAYPGTVVVADDVHAALSEDPRFSWRSLRPRPLKDIGRVQLWHVTRPGDDTEARRDARRLRRARSFRLIPDLQRLASIGRDFVDGVGGPRDTPPET